MYCLHSNVNALKLNIVSAVILMFLLFQNMSVKVLYWLSFVNRPIADVWVNELQK